jgi:outer membrane protein TolC
MAIYRFWLPALIGSLGLLGCSNLPPDKPDPFSGIEQQHLPVAGLTLDLTESERQARVDELLQQSLTPTQAMELMLINSPQVRVELAELGIAQAQQLQAGLLSNPRFGLGALRPEGGGRWQLDAGISQSILDIFTRPLRKQLADAEFTAAQIKLHLRLSQQLYKVQHHYYKTLAASELTQLQAAHYQAAEANLSLAQSLFKAGNIPERHLLQYQLDAQAQMRQQQETEMNARQKQIALGALLGLDSAAVIQLPKKLPSLPGADNFTRTELITIAKQKRSDLQLARTQVRATENSLALQNKMGAFTEIELGANVERESDGSYKAGPEIAFSLPVFDRGHARAQSAQATIQRSQALLQAQEIQTEAEISSALLVLNNARASVEHIEQTSLPLQRKVQTLKLREYNFMLSSAFELIQLKQQEFDLTRERTNALLAYWQARSALALASGQSLAVDTKPTPEKPAPEKIAPEVDHPMHNHGDHHHD